ncbi:uncharacterized protein [Watersipora subatra]|uniref:uncharacterized protein n=1 Tax=Watersipora subatra TaxID=2589382 RepID=UPI00355B13A2
MASSHLAELNKWRIQQFRRNNQESRSPDKDFVCLSPEMLEEKPNYIALFLDSDEEKPVSALESEGLVVVGAPKNTRKRAKLRCTELMDESDEAADNRPVTRQVAAQAAKAFKALPLRPISASKKTAVVSPITKVDHAQTVDSKMNTSDVIKSDISSPEKVNDSSPLPKITMKKTDNMDDSDSELSLFEVDFLKDSSKTLQPIANPPPSPRERLHSASSSPTAFLINPHEDGPNSDDSDSEALRKTSRKGKQPANKRRKVVTKCSKPLVEKMETKCSESVVDNATIKASQAVAKVPNKTKDEAVAASSTEDDIIIVSSSASKSDLTLDDTAPHDKKLRRSDRGRNESLNRAVVKPNSSVIFIEDDDEDVVMLTNSEKDQQFQDDLEYALRLQAQFDEENYTAINAHRPNPDHRQAESGRGSSSTKRIRFTDSPLPERSERLLHAIGASSAVTEFLGSPRTSQRRASLPELDDVENRLNFLRQLALDEYVDDAVITEVLGVPVPPPQMPPSQGPVPPSLRQPNRRNAGSTSRGMNQQQSMNAFRRTLQDLGMFEGEDDSYESLLELAERIGDARQAGLEPELISQLPCRRYKEGEAKADGLQCRICMSDFENGEEIRTLNCFHDYHSSCIDQWLQKKATCPVCRVKVAFE